MYGWHRAYVRACCWARRRRPSWRFRLVGRPWAEGIDRETAQPLRTRGGMSSRTWRCPRARLPWTAVDRGTLSPNVCWDGATVVPLQACTSVDVEWGSTSCSPGGSWSGRITLIQSALTSGSFRFLGVAERLHAVASDSLELSLGEDPPRGDCGPGGPLPWSEEDVSVALGLSSSDGLSSPCLSFWRSWSCRRTDCET